MSVVSVKVKDMKGDPSPTKPHQLRTDWLTAFVTLILLSHLSPNFKTHVFSEQRLDCDPVLTMSIHNVCLYLPCV